MLQNLTKSVHNQVMVVSRNKVDLVTVWNVDSCILFIIRNYLILYGKYSREHASHPLSLNLQMQRPTYELAREEPSI